MRGKESRASKNGDWKMRGPGEVNTHTSADQERGREGRELVIQDIDELQKHTEQDRFWTAEHKCKR